MLGYIYLLYPRRQVAEPEPCHTTVFKPSRFYPVTYLHSRYVLTLICVNDNRAQYIGTTVHKHRHWVSNVLYTYTLYIPPESSRLYPM